jgi:hypothetical protein
VLRLENIQIHATNGQYTLEDSLKTYRMRLAWNLLRIPHQPRKNLVRSGGGKWAQKSGRRAASGLCSTLTHRLVSTIVEEL